MKKLPEILFYFSILLFIVAFGFRDAMVGNWYQQFLPNIGNRTISDIFFLDSLTGWAVTPYLSVNDTSYVLKTTNGGDNWFIQHSRIGQFVGSNRVKFLNANTGYTAGVSDLPAYSCILKTTNGGNIWFNINSPTDPFTARDISILNEDTMWVVSDNSLTGGVFRTINGGASWQNQLNLGSQNPVKIYFFNGSTGYISKNTGSSYVRKTTDGGVSWSILFNSEGFTDMYFANALTGWKAFGTMKKTTDGGNIWVNQPIPFGGNIIVSSLEKFSNVSIDTIWGVGGYISTGVGARAMIYRTTNGGDNWLFQVPDSNINIFKYFHVKFVNSRIGWAYTPLTGVHTILGGDPVWVTGIQQISNIVPKEFMLEQNYPNPFNPVTKIKFSLKNQTSNVKLIVYDISGKEVVALINQKQSAGTYEVDFSGNNYSSGIYLYSLIIEGKVIDTKKMILLK